MSNETHQAIAREAADLWCDDVATEGPPLQPDEKDLLVKRILAAISRSHEPRHGIDLANIVRKRLETLATDMIPLSTACSEVLLAEAKAVESLISDLSPQRSHEPAAQPQRSEPKYSITREATRLMHKDQQPPATDDKPQFNLETLDGRKAAWEWLTKQFENPLIVTKGGVPMEDQLEGISQFKDAALKPATDDKLEALAQSWEKMAKTWNAQSAYDTFNCHSIARVFAECSRELREIMSSSPATDDRVKEWKESGDGLSVFCGNELVINMRDKTNYRMQVIRLMEAYRRVKEQGSHADDQKWTAETVDRILGDKGYRGLAKAINAAVKELKDEIARLEEISELKKTISAEREKVRKLHLPASSAALYDAFEEIKRIRQQLLQAEEKLKQYESNKS
jgi:hypothetical protein